jgi:biopolymer transport protein ExbD
MGMKVSAQTGDDQPMLDMNTTPLIDVMLVLLVMLIITIPMQLHSVNMNMPKAALSAAQTKPSIIKIHIDAGNLILWNDKPLANQSELQTMLVNTFAASADVASQPEVHIKPSDSAKYEHVAAVLSAAQRAGLKKIGMVSAPMGSSLSAQP